MNRLATLLIGMIIATTSIGCAPEAAPEEPGQCLIVGLRDKLADDPTCVMPERSDVTLVKVPIEEHIVWYWGRQVGVDPSGFMPLAPKPETRQYPHVHISVERFIDRDIVTIVVSDRCHVEQWDKAQFNLGCAGKLPWGSSELTSAESVTILSKEVVEQLEANASKQGIASLTYALEVLTPDAIQPDGSSGEDYPF